MNYKEQDVINYRRNKLSMPWFHTHLTDWKPKQGIIKDFEVVTIPKAILVDKKGFIVAVNTRTRDFYDKVMEFISNN